MILPRYRIVASRISQAGQGLILDEPIARGRVIVAPDRVHTVITQAELNTHAPDSIEARSSVRWFENRYSLTPEWSDECYINHSYSPTALWHLGFVFALTDLAPGDEVTMDYCLLIGENEEMEFRDTATGRAIVGLPWKDSVLLSAQRLIELLANKP